MKPKERHPQSADLFHQPLEEIINVEHPLAKLARLMDWSVFERECSGRFASATGRPASSGRLVAGLLYLQHTFSCSDETLLETWVDDPYWQYFCGEAYFQHKAPVDTSSLSRWRRRMGEEGVEWLLSVMLDAARKTQLISVRSAEKLAEASMPEYEIRNEKIIVSITDIDYATLEMISRNYFKDKNGVYYSPSNLDYTTFHEVNSDVFTDEHISRLKTIPMYYIPGVDVSTFKVLSRGKSSIAKNYGDIISSYAKDKNFVYYRGAILQGVDPKTFEFLCVPGEIFADYGFIRDKNYVFYDGYHNGLKRLIHADSASFVLLTRDRINEFYYAKDKNNVYLNSHIIEGADVASFICLNKCYAKDKNNAYYLLGVIEGADVASFICLNRCYAKDKNNAYCLLDVIEGAHVKTFDTLDDDIGWVAHDDKNIYRNGKQINKIWYKVERWIVDIKEVIKEEFPPKFFNGWR